MSNIYKMRGFTLIEILVAIAILAIVMAIAIPDFTSTIQNNTIATISNDLISSINLARSEAVKRNVTVSICATSNSNFTACGNNWNLGWLVFVNPTGGNALSNTAAAPLLRIQRINDQSATIATTPTVGILTYSGNGFTATGTGNLSITIKATGCTTDSGRRIAISATGRPSVTNVTCP